MYLLNRKALRIAITGSMGSGKSWVATVFQFLGIPVYNADREAKKLYDDPNLQKELVQLFGSDILLPNKGLNTKRLAEIVFAEPSEMRRLNEKVHPLIRENFNQWVLQNEKDFPYLIMESAILFEAGFDKDFDSILCVQADMSLMMERCRKRDGLSDQQIKARFAIQWPPEQKAQNAHYKIQNNTDDLLLPQILNIHNQLLAAYHAT